MVNGVTGITPATWEAEAESRWRPVWATESDFSRNNKIFKGTKVDSPVLYYHYHHSDPQENNALLLHSFLVIISIVYESHYVAQTSLKLCLAQSDFELRSSWLPEYKYVPPCLASACF